MVQEIYALVSGHIKWDMPLRIEVQSQAMGYYWHTLLQRSFPQASIHFYDKSDEHMRGELCQALGVYASATHKKKGYSVMGWRYWLKGFQNWVEYHL